MTDSQLISQPPADDTALDFEPVSLEAALRDIGLAPVKAWIPDPESKRTSATAKRTKKSRDKAAEQGLKQISITMPIELHPLARELASQTKAGVPVAEVLDALKHTVVEPEVRLGPPRAPSTLPATITPELKPAIEQLSAWRRWLIGLILPRKMRHLLDQRGAEAQSD